MKDNLILWIFLKDKKYNIMQDWNACWIHQKKNLYIFWPFLLINFKFFYTSYFVQQNSLSIFVLRVFFWDTLYQTWPKRKMFSHSLIFLNKKISEKNKKPIYNQIRKEIKIIQVEKRFYGQGFTTISHPPHSSHHVRFHIFIKNEH